MRVSEEARQEARDAVRTYAGEIVPMALENLDSGRSCTVCGGDEYVTTDGEAICTVTEHRDECECGGEIVARSLRVEIDSFLPFGHTQLVDAECTECGEVSELTGEATAEVNEPTDVATFQVATDVLEKPHPLHRHHTSYVPEETVLVCATCHSRIHQEQGFREDLMPEMSRGEWEETRFVEE